MSLTTAIARLQALALACNGVKAAPATVPNNIAVFPFSIAYPERGELTSEAFDSKRAIHVVIVEFHAGPTTMQGKAINDAMPLLEEYHGRLVADPTLNATVSNIVFPVPYEFGKLEWAGVETIGFRLHIPLKLRGQAST